MVRLLPRGRRVTARNVPADVDEFVVGRLRDRGRAEFAELGLQLLGVQALVERRVA